MLGNKPFGIPIVGEVIPLRCGDIDAARSARLRQSARRDRRRRRKSSNPTFSPFGPGVQKKTDERRPAVAGRIACSPLGGLLHLRIRSRHPSRRQSGAPLVERDSSKSARGRFSALAFRPTAVPRPRQFNSGYPARRRSRPSGSPRQSGANRGVIEDRHRSRVNIDHHRGLTHRARPRCGAFRYFASFAEGGQAESRMRR